MRLKREEGPILRLTYCSLADPKPRLQCFTEISGKGHASHGKISTASYELVGSTSPVVFLNTMKMLKAENRDANMILVAVHENGAIRCLTENLSEELWSSASGFRPDASGIPNTRVLCAAVLDVDEARRGILKNREDIVAKLQGVKDLSGIDNSASDLLVILAQPTILNSGTARNTVEMEIYSTRASLSNPKMFLNEQQHTTLEQLASLSITDSDLLYSNESSYFIHTSSGTLYNSKGRSLRVYDFTYSVPLLTQQLQLKNRIHSSLRLSSSSVACVTSADIYIMDSQYQAVLSTTSLEPSPEDSPLSKRTRRKDKTRLLSYFASLDIIVALQGRNLISYQFSNSNSIYAGGHKRARNSKLIDALDRGIRNNSIKSAVPTKAGSVSDSFGMSLHEDTVDQNWEDLKTQLDVLVADGNVEDFDALVATDIVSQQNGSKNETINGRPNEASPQKQRYPRSKLVYLISKIFNVEHNMKTSDHTSSIHSSLTIAFLPKKLFRWLIANDCFSRQYIESILKQSEKLKLSAYLQPAAIVFALVGFDETLGELLRLLESPSFLTARELVYAMRIGLETLRGQDDLSDQKLLTNGEVNGAAESEVEMSLVKGHLEHDSDPTLRSAKQSNAHEVIRYSLVRFHKFHETDIRDALRTELPHPTLLSFVDFLRMDLAQGGWLSHYVDDEESRIVPDKASCTINIATKLFNCAIDCLGTGSWISGAMNTANANNMDTIAYMKAEVSAALECIEEAAYLKSMLNEVLLYSKTVKIRPPVHRNDDSGLIRPITVAVQTSEDKVLPLGLKANQAPSLTKIGAGGEIQERSMRDIGRLKSREVGAYSFERIMIQCQPRV